MNLIDALFPDARYVFLQRDGRENVNSLINAWRTPRYRTYRLPESHSIPGADPEWWKFVLYPGWRADRNGPLEVVCAKQWLTSNEFALSGLEEIDGERSWTVRYEALIDDPVSEVGRLLAGLGLRYTPELRRKALGIESTPINVVTPPERGKWRRENPDEIERILPLIEPMMGRLGYLADRGA